MQMIPYQKAATQPTTELLDQMGSRVSGLFGEEAVQRLKEIPVEHKKGAPLWLTILLRQFKSAFIYLLLAAALISFFLGEIRNGALILLFLVINATLGFYQEYHAEKSLSTLNTLLTRKANVRRAGKVITCETPDIVPGDVIVLSAGDMIPADGRFLMAEHVLVDESSLTGEAIPVSKVTAHLPNIPVDYGAAINIGFARTTLVEGNAELLVASIGEHTEVGVIVTEIDKTRRVSAFEEGMTKFSGAILRMVLAMIPIMFLLNIYVHKEAFEAAEFFVFVIALTISAIPEALPLVTTLALSRGALVLAKKSVIPRRLTAVEDLGTIEVLCTDKTGTITENELTVKDIYGDRNTVIHEFLRDPLTSESENQWNVFDHALMKLGGDWKMTGVTRIMELAFDPDRRRESVLLDDGKRRFIVVRGGPEYLHSTGVDKRALTWAKERGLEGCRVLGLTVKDVPRGTNKITAEIEDNGTFIGMVAFFDPLKPSAKDAIRDAEKLGVKVKIITGDSAEVAGWVGYEAGIIKNPNHVMTGVQFMALSEGEKLVAVRKYDVFARTSPLEKKEIIAHLKERHIVGFLGEGFNDAPALKLAHVGLVVENASDIARDAADVVLVNKSLSVIIDGIREGRIIFTNTIKYIRATLTSNFGNFYALAFSTLFVPYLPMLPIQVLLLNLLSDFPMITIAADSVDAVEVHKPRRYNIGGVLKIAVILGIVATIFDFIFFLYFRGGEGSDPRILQTMWFMGSILTELILLFSIRTMLPFWRATRPSGLVVWFTLAVMTITILLPYAPLGRELFSFIAPNIAQMSAMFAIVVAYFITTEAVKLLAIRYAPSLKGR